ncbi:MAG TPA: hypothetical protein VFJ04_01265 [Rhodanobacteraceae bacterium]|nr:hypothetical protein [Rhodanobacteraceae bacterium]
MSALYVALLLAGLIGFVLHLFAQYRIATIMRRRYPRQWDIVARPEHGRRGGIRTYARLQQVLRADVPTLFDDARLHAWHRCWRYAPWVAWPCWIGALALQVAGHP